MSRDKNNVLFVSYYFPPAGGSGVLRIIRFIKNLKHFNKNPFIITVDNRDVQKLVYGTIHTDDSYLYVEDLVKVKRVRLIRPSSIAVSMIKSVKRIFLCILMPGKSKVTRRNRSKNHSKIDGQKHEARNIRNYYSSDIKLALKFVFELMIIIDQAFEWAPRAIWHGIRFVKYNNIGFVCSSSPPISVHFVGYMLKLLCRTRWILDMRDPIFGIETSELRTKTSPWPIRMYYRMLESILIRGADVVVCNCEEVKRYYENKYSRTRFEVITNSFDPDDFDGLQIEPESRTYRVISHFGELYTTIRTPDSFLRALAAVVKNNFLSHEMVKVHFYGAGPYVHSKSFQELIESLDIVSMVSVYDYMPHDIVLQEMISSDILLLLQPHYSTNYQIPAKLYEYIAARRPILTVAPHGSATERLITEHNLGLVCDSEDSEALESAVIAALNEELPVPDYDVVEQFSSRHMTGKLVKIIEAMS